MVSNHGGRQLDGVQATIDALPAIVQAVNETKPSVEVYVDGGIREGNSYLLSNNNYHSYLISNNSYLLSNNNYLLLNKSYLLSNNSYLLSINRYRCSQSSGFRSKDGLYW